MTICWAARYNQESFTDEKLTVIAARCFLERTEDTLTPIEMARARTLQAVWLHEEDTRDKHVNELLKVLTRKKVAAKKARNICELRVE